MKKGKTGPVYLLIACTLLAILSVIGYLVLRHQISDGEILIDAGEKKLEAGHTKLEAGKAELIAGKEELAEGKEEYADAHDNPLLVLADNVFQGGEAFEEGREKIADGNRQVAAGELAIEAGEKKLNAGEVKLGNGQEEMERAKILRIVSMIGALVFSALALGSLIWMRRQRKGRPQGPSIDGRT